MGKKAKPRAKTHPDVEIRYHDDGTVDEIIVKSNGVCLFHLEQMSNRSYWIGLASADGENTVHVDVYSDKKITARVRV